MDIQTIDLTADRNTIAGGPHRVFQAHALNLTLTLPTGENLDGADTLFAEIHYSRTITPASILASAELPLTTGDAEGPFDLSFTAAQAAAAEARQGCASVIVVILQSRQRWCLQQTRTLRRLRRRRRRRWRQRGAA